MIRRIIKHVWRDEWGTAADLRDQLTSEGVEIPVVNERPEQRDATIATLRSVLRTTRRLSHGSERVEKMLQTVTASARAQKRKLRAATTLESAVSTTLGPMQPKWFRRLDVSPGQTACIAHEQRLTSIEDESHDWRTPEIEKLGESGWRFPTNSGLPPPTFDSCAF